MRRSEYRRLQGLVGTGVLALKILVASVVSAQVEMQPADEAPPFNVDAICFASTSSSLTRLDVYVQVPYENLAFTKQADGYRASYEMSVSILDSTGQVAAEKLWTEQVKAETFEQSISSYGYSLAQRVFELAPGTYVIHSVVRDDETGVSHKRQQRITVSDFSGEGLLLSDIMLVSRITTTGGKKTIVPNVSPNVGLVSEAFHVFFEAYNKTGLDSIVLHVAILNDAKERVTEFSQPHRLSAGRNQVFLRIENTTLPIGDYVLYVRALRNEEPPDAQSFAVTSRAFVMRWRGLPRGIKDLNLAIEQCVYIAKDSEMDHMREESTPEEKQKRFLEFWRRRDPNPSTPRNERLEEHYARVEYANKNFKHYIDGWRTDMGMVYIIFGSPNNVDRHPFDIDSKPYEVWTYYDMNYSFVFVDHTGFGDYRLLKPITDVWQRPRD
jgi:GWxTD domain-containing protein